ncbi:hypothetical protein [Azospirillum doebereinerae]|uniref:Class I SAM-dependent methyltransferase n=1 Tax=Azospirillum doebereinerae TaxID=92933 RepID=A0A3S0XCI3_9PROT|nr:hypothetical protein [Azospirillum doebereinerae]MCG5242776.1 hypothetical protein [Azospirillum doebereinerae]RUQ73775.1 hypothetical protein EJ913_08960 [Azospirillum doebereinerae]
MPFSSMLGKSLTVLTAHRFNAQRPVSQVIDVGPGLGTYGRLLRPVLPDARFVAVEIWGPYVKEYGLAEIYDAVHVADARVFDYRHLDRGGIAVLGDVLEHMTKDEAQRVVLALLERCDMVILSIPIGNWPQDEYMGNPWEAHVASYGPGDVRRVFPYNVAEITFNINDDASAGIGVFVLSQKLGLQDSISSCFIESIDLVKANPGLMFCGLPNMTDLSDPALVARFFEELSPFLDAFPGQPA